VSPTASHDAQMNDDGFHEIQLSGKQLVFLFMLASVVLVATFLCGVQVGRGVRSDRGIEAAQTEAVSTAAPPPTASSSLQPAGTAGPPAAEPPAPAQEPDDELSYAKRLQSDNPPAEKLKSPSQTPAPAPPPSPASPATAGRESRPSPSAASTRPIAPAPTADATPSGGQPGAWIVQLTALQDRSAATGIAKRLTGKGYPAFVLDPAPGAPTIYRVQVGGYADKHEADQVARRLEKDEQYKPYVRPR
jgi:cell division septation protein DedD